MCHKKKAKRRRKRRRLIAKDVVVDEMNIKSVTLNEKDSGVKHYDFKRSHDFPMEENENFDFSLQEMNTKLTYTLWVLQMFNEYGKYNHLYSCSS